MLRAAEDVVTGDRSPSCVSRVGTRIENVGPVRTRRVTLTLGEWRFLSEADCHYKIRTIKSGTIKQYVRLKNNNNNRIKRFMVYRVFTGRSLFS